MGKRYYCDYCDRSFADTGVNRKNHFKGSVHQRLKKQHYDSFRDAATILADEATKLPCKRFQSGMCDFGDSCRFSHMTVEKRSWLEQRVKNEREEKARKAHQHEEEPSLEQWLEKRQRRLGNQTSAPDDVNAVNFQLPPFLVNIPNLPPSLLPPTDEELKSAAHIDWG